MTQEEDFNCMIGTTIKYCQCIENDIKLIYSGMLKGGWQKNYPKIKNNTLGTIVNKLQKLDYSDNKPYFSKSDYKLLREITGIRNYWAHQGYLDYVYDISKFPEQYKKLYSDNERLANLQEETENIRLHFFGYPTN